MNNTLTIYRDDFKPLSDGGTYFDVILDNLKVPESLQASIMSMDIAFRDDYLVAWNENDERIFSIPSNF